MHFDILTLFPDLIYNYTDESILGRAQSQGLINVSAHNFRDFSGNKYGHVDDKPYGGGPGMVLRVEPIYECLKAIGTMKLRNKEIKKLTPKLKIENSKLKIIALDPAGKKFDQRMAESFSKFDRLVIISGRYEGFDARIYELADERVSVGEYVLAGGELPALTIVEAVSRLIPGVLGNAESLNEETFGSELKLRNKETKKLSKISQFPNFPISHKEHPQYTRPPEFMGKKVPKVLLSGDHKKIAEWRSKN